MEFPIQRENVWYYASSLLREWDWAVRFEMVGE